MLAYFLKLPTTSFKNKLKSNFGFSFNPKRTINNSYPKNVIENSTFVFRKILNRHMFDIQKIRADFPILTQKVNGKPLVYFDNGATSQNHKSLLMRPQNTIKN